MAEQTMVERVAKAIVTRQRSGRSFQMDEDESVALRQAEGLARAAIEAMEAMTDDMRAAMLAAYVRVPQDAPLADRMWKAGIVAALKD